ncbi:DUF1176 domain-containing protein [Shigella flexneri]
MALSGDTWQLTPWLPLTDDTGTITTFLKTIQEGQEMTLRDGKQTISLTGLKAASPFIDAQQKRVEVKPHGSRRETHCRSAYRPRRVKEVAAGDRTPTPLSREER